MIRRFLTALGLTLCLAGCSGSAPQPPKQNQLTQTAGGGTAIVGTYRLSIRVGAPQPAGTRQLDDQTLSTGPLPEEPSP